MLQRFRPRITYANVASTLALFLALTTGTAYAANEWTGANIRDNTITGADIKGLAGTATAKANNGGITTDDIWGQAANAGNGTTYVDGTITEWDVKNGSLHGDRDIADNTITTFDLADNSVDSDEVLDFGLTNEDIGILYARVNADGTLASSSGGVSSVRLGLGQLEVSFGRNVSACALLVTQGEATSSGGAQGAIVGAVPRFNNVAAVFVTVRSDPTTYVDRAVSVVVVC